MLFECDGCGRETKHDLQCGLAPSGWRFRKLGGRVLTLCGARCGQAAEGVTPSLRRVAVAASAGATRRASKSIALPLPAHEPARGIRLANPGNDTSMTPAGWPQSAPQGSGLA